MTIGSGHLYERLVLNPGKPSNEDTNLGLLLVGLTRVVSLDCLAFGTSCINRDRLEAAGRSSLLRQRIAAIGALRDRAARTTAWYARECARARRREEFRWVCCGRRPHNK